MTRCLLLTPLFIALCASRVPAEELSPLAVGVAGHAFDHPGNIGDQAPRRGGERGERAIELTLPRVQISTILVIE